jgi:hypothetical protein
MLALLDLSANETQSSNLHVHVAWVGNALDGWGFGRFTPDGLDGVPCGDGDGGARPVRTTPTPREPRKPS